MRKHYTIFEKTGEGHLQADEHWKFSKATLGETSKRRGGAHMGFSERVNDIVNLFD